MNRLIFAVIALSVLTAAADPEYQPDHLLFIHKGICVYMMKSGHARSIPCLPADAPSSAPSSAPK